jgi:hypothetical protein
MDDYELLKRVETLEKKVTWILEYLSVKALKDNQDGF